MIKIKKYIPSVKVIPKIRDATVHSMSKLSDNTIARTTAASNFLTTVADVFCLLHM